jgi:ABC-type transport system involved in multi-copper enzyme maturation permease subunit
MSTAISDEIHHATLGTLMTTPITSLQVVMGKLLSRLWHLVVLLAVSLPVLTLVRVFGGVSWSYVVSSTCVTLSSAIFLGSVSLYFSIFNRRAYAAILKTAGTAVVLFGLLPAVLACAFLSGPNSNRTNIIPVLVCGNPFMTLGVLTSAAQQPGAIGFYFCWPITCGAMLAGAALLLALSVGVVRKVALRQATGEAGTFISRRRLKKRQAAAAAAPPIAAIEPGRAAAPPEAGGVPAKGLATKGGRRPGRIREVTGSPVVWRELRQGMVARASLFSALGCVIIATGLIIICGYAICEGEQKHSGMHVAFVCILGLLGLLPTAVLSATSITTEKEARSWPLLMATPMTEAKILWGKSVGIWRRSLPAWVPLAAYLLIFTSWDYLHPLVPLCLTLTAAGAVAFLTGTGLYLGTLLRRTTAAVIANICTAAAVWILIPILLGLIGLEEPARAGVALVTWPNPGLQAVIVTAHAAGSRREQTLSFDWPGKLWDQIDSYSSSQRMTGAQSILVIGTCSLCYGGVSLLLAWRAQRRLRRNIF